MYISLAHPSPTSRIAGSAIEASPIERSDQEMIFPELTGELFEPEPAERLPPSDRGSFISGGSVSRALGVPRPVSIATGLTLALTAGAIGQGISQPPRYEGSFQLVAQPVVTEGSSRATGQPGDQPSPSPPTVDRSVQVRLLRSPRLVDPVLRRLQIKQPELDYHAFVDQLELRFRDDQTLEVRYHDTDPQRLQLVLQQLAQLYIDHGKDCETGVCQGLQFIEAQLPQVRQRISDRREQIRQFHQQYGFNNLEAQLQLFAHRATEITQQSADLEAQLAETTLVEADLRLRMGLADGETIAEPLLSQDVTYQALLQQFQAIDQQLIAAMSRYQLNSDIETLRFQHQQILTQVEHQANQLLPRRLADPMADLQDPIFQEPQLLALLQRSIQTAHYHHILEIRQQTLRSVQESLTSQRQALTVALDRYGDLRQQLQADTTILQTYLDKRDWLRTQLQPSTLSWQLAQAPALVTTATGDPVPDYLQQAPAKADPGALMGLLLGMAVAYVLEERRTARPHPVTPPPMSIECVRATSASFLA